MRMFHTSTSPTRVSNRIWNNRPIRQLNGSSFTKRIPNHRSRGPKVAVRTSFEIQLQNTLSKTNRREPYSRSKRSDSLIVANICSPFTQTKCKIRVTLPFGSQVCYVVYGFLIVLHPDLVDYRQANGENSLGFT